MVVIFIEGFEKHGAGFVGTSNIISFANIGGANANVRNSAVASTQLALQKDDSPDSVRPYSPSVRP